MSQSKVIMSATQAIPSEKVEHDSEVVRHDEEVAGDVSRTDAAEARAALRKVDKRLIPLLALLYLLAFLDRGNGWSHARSNVVSS